MLYLHQYPSIWGLSSLSPFCIKIETYLKMVNLPYEIIIENNPRRGPKGKMPVLRDDKLIVPDSTFIIQYLKNTYGDALDANLSVNQRALAHAVRKMIEENLYFVILYSRWIDKQGKKIIDNAFSRFFPKPLASLALAWIRRNLRKQAMAQGIGRHSLRDIYHIGYLDIQSIADLLGDNQYFLGDEPHTIDATVYAFLETILLTPINSQLNHFVCDNANLLSYCVRMRNRYFHK